MKIRMDFVTNSSSSSFVLVMRFTLRSGEVIKYSTTGSFYPETDGGEHNMMEVRCDPKNLGRSATVGEMIEKLEDGVRDRDPRGDDKGAPSRRVLSSGSKLIRQLSKIPSMDDISKITINADTYVGNGGEGEHKYQHYTYDRDYDLTVGDEGGLGLIEEGSGGNFWQVPFDVQGRSFGMAFDEKYTRSGGYDQDVEPEPDELIWKRTAPRDRSVYRFEDYYTDMCLTALGFEEMNGCIERYALAGAGASDREHYSQLVSRLKRGCKQGENRLQIREKRFCSSYTGEFRTRMGELIARCGGVLEDELSDETDTFILSLLPGTQASALEAACAWQKRHPRRSIISDYTLWELLLDEGLRPSAEEIAWCAARGLNLENALREEPLSEEELAQEQARQTALAKYRERMKKACEAHASLEELILPKDKRKPFRGPRLAELFLSDQEKPVQIYGRSFCLDAYPDATRQCLSEEIGARGGRVVQKSRKYDYLVVPVIPWQPDEYPESDEEAEEFRKSREYSHYSHREIIKANCKTWDSIGCEVCRSALEKRDAGKGAVHIISDYQLFVAFESQPRYTEEALDRMSSEETQAVTRQQETQKQAEKQARQQAGAAQQEEKQKLQAMKDALLQTEKEIRRHFENEQILRRAEECMTAYRERVEREKNAVTIDETPADLSGVLYLPGEEPESLRARIERLLKKLEEAYPDRVVYALTRDHKKWAETLGELYRLCGYGDPDSFLKAHGFQVGRVKTGKPAGNIFAPLEELRRRYPNGSDFATLQALKAANPDINLTTLQGQSNELFGTTFAKYLTALGILK